jgi:hypothetical protein
METNTACHNRLHRRGFPFKAEAGILIAVAGEPLRGNKLKSVFLGGLAAAGLAVLAGCSTVTTGSTGTNLASAGGATGTIRIINDSGEYINVVLLSDCDAFTYGMDNKLGQNDGIAHGSYRDFTVPAGCWDVAAGSIGVGDVRQRMEIPGNGIFEFTVG